MQRFIFRISSLLFRQQSVMSFPLKKEAHRKIIIQKFNLRYLVKSAVEILPCFDDYTQCHGFKDSSSKIPRVHLLCRLYIYSFQHSVYIHKLTTISHRARHRKRLSLHTPFLHSFIKNKGTSKPLLHWHFLVSRNFKIQVHSFA